MFHKFRLKAGQDYHVAIGGRVILVDSTGAADGVTITPMRGSSAIRELPDRQKAFKCVVDFDSVVLRAPVDCEVALFLSMTDVSLGFTDTSMLKVSGEVRVTNDGDNPVSVLVENGNATPVAVKNQALATLADLAPVAVGVARVALANDPTLRRLRVRNGSAGGVVAIGGAGVTLANAVLVLGPGEVWLEDDAPGAAWYAIADADGATVQIQGVKA